MPAAAGSKRTELPVPAPKVFAVVELLEMVLTDVPPLQLFVLQHVNKTFEGTIKGSKTLRCKMCLEPSDTTTLATVWEMLDSAERDGEARSSFRGSLHYLNRFAKPFRFTPYHFSQTFTLDLELDSDFVDKRKSPADALFDGEKCVRPGSWKDIMVQHEDGRSGNKERIEEMAWSSSGELARLGWFVRRDRTIKKNATFGDVLDIAKDMTKEIFENSLKKHGCSFGELRVLALARVIKIPCQRGQ